MDGAMSLCPLYAFMARRATLLATLLVHVYIFVLFRSKYNIVIVQPIKEYEIYAV